MPAGMRRSEDIRTSSERLVYIQFTPCVQEVSPLNSYREGVTSGKEGETLEKGVKHVQSCNKDIRTTSIT